MKIRMLKSEKKKVQGRERGKVKTKYEDEEERNKKERNK